MKACRRYIQCFENKILQVMNQDNVDCLSREIECLICLNPANDPRMCIHCSAIICAKCIEDWITQKKNACPKCSHAVQRTDFVKCRLASKIIDFIETNKTDNLIPSEETPGAPHTTCQDDIQPERISINAGPVNLDYNQISTLNTKLLDFVRKRWKENHDNLQAINLAIQMLEDDIVEDRLTTETFITEVPHLFDDYRKRQKTYRDMTKIDEVIINEVESRLKKCRSLSDQEAILQILQRHIPSQCDQ